MENILNKLDDLENRLQELKSVNYQKGRDEYRSITQLLERIIERIYPEKDARQIKSKLYRGGYVACERTEEEEQEEYLYDINLATRVIGTIKEEHELFGFDDFKSLKEKVKTETEVGLGNFIRHKKTKEK